MELELDWELNRMVHLTSFAYKQNWRRSPTRDVAFDRPGPALYVQAVADILEELKGDKFAVSYIQKVDGIDLIITSDQDASERKRAFLRKVRKEMLVIRDKVEANSNYGRFRLHAEVLREDIQLYKFVLWHNRYQVRHKLEKHMGLVRMFCKTYLRKRGRNDVSALVRTDRLRTLLYYFSEFARAGDLDSRAFDKALQSDKDMELFAVASLSVPRSKEDLRVIDCLAKAMNIQGDVCHAIRQSMKQVQAIRSLCKLARPSKRRHCLENMQIILIGSGPVPPLRHPKPGMWDWLLRRSLSKYTMYQLERTLGFSFDFVSKADDHSNECGKFHPEMLILIYLSDIRKANPSFKTIYTIGLNKPSCYACFQVLSRIDWLEYGFERFALQLNSNRRPRTNGKMCVHGWRLPRGVDIASNKVWDIVRAYERYLVEGLTHVWPPGSEEERDGHQIVARGPIHL